MVKIKRRVQKADDRKQRQVRYQRRWRADESHEIMLSNRKKRNRAAARVARKARRVARRHRR